MVKGPPPTKATPPPVVRRSRLLNAIARATALPPKLVEHPATTRILMLAIGLSWGFMLSSGASIDPEEFAAGAVAPRTVRSPTQLIAEDPEATAAARQAAADKVLPIVDYRPQVANQLQERTAEAMELLREAPGPTEDLHRRVEEALGIPLEPARFEALYDQREDLSFELKLKDVIRTVYQQRVAAERDRWSVAYPRGVALRTAGEDGGDRQTLEPSQYGRVRTIPEAVDAAERAVRSRYPESPPAQRSLLAELAGAMVVPDLLPNPVATDDARQAAAEAIKPVLFQLQPGEVVVRSGERVSPAQMKRLRAIYEQEATPHMLMVRVVKVALVVLAVFLLVPYGRSGNWRAMGHPQDLVFLLVISTLLLGLIRMGTALAEPLVFALPDLPRASIIALMPFATLGMIFRLFFRPKVAFAIAVLFALAVSLYLEPVLLILPLTLLGPVVGIRRLQHSKRRSQFQWAGLHVGATQTVIWLLFTLTDPNILPMTAVQTAAMPLVGGFFAAVLASTLMPVGEWIGRYVSEVRLLELAQDDQPLLKWLHLNAPGTYNHSISVGRLAETAAERIGADVLLSRVGAYYHDIGKAFWPQYFIENQRGSNPHDQIKPQLSARVIIAHVTHGAELARKHGLPPVLVDFILEHHGTSRVEYFFRQAQEHGGEKESIEDDSVFRYPGPRPHSKETALVMLADVVESASRTLDAPTPDKIRTFVTRLIGKVYQDGQLDESPLTLKDLSATEAAFTEVLVAMYHHRIDYPLGLKPGSKSVTPLPTAG